jgi:NitT/TauT family transport system ATP-binding protein
LRIAWAQRRAKTAEHTALVDTIYQIMTNPAEDVAKLLPRVPGARRVQEEAPRPAYQVLPHVGIGELTGFIERLHALGDRADLYVLARDLHQEADDLLPLVEAADLLGFGDIREGDALLTPAGQRFAEAGVLEEKSLFRQQALDGIQLLRQIARELEASPTHEMQEAPLLESLEQVFSPDEARRQLDTAIDWGRYAELFAYDDDTGEFTLEEDGSMLAEDAATY